jgi:2-polyprenyl-3-methyl-5-hydroxy-6-metoxy-1,4-benzoquinol methylase
MKLSSGVSAETDYRIRDQQRMQRAHNYFEWQARLACPPLGQRVMEIGCGIGTFTRHLLDRECVVGIDVDAECVAQLERNLGTPPNLTARHMDILDDAAVNLREHRIDSVVCLNVLEHVSDDHRALRQMAALLPARGRVVLIVPAFGALYGPIDSKLGHYRRYSKASLRALAAATNFRVTQLRYMNLIGFFGWWFNARVLKKEEQSDAQIAAFDKIVVPVISRVERLLPPPLGQSLFVVLEKEAGQAGA